MAKVETGKRLLRALRGEVLTPPPLWLMRQAGRYLPEYREVRAKAKDFLEFCYSPELATEVTLQPLRRFPLDAAILFSDILVVPDALGQRVEFRDNEGPVLDPVRDRTAVAKLRAASVHDRFAPIYDTVQRIKRALPPEATLIGFAGAPWTVAVYMVEGRGGTDCHEIRKFALQKSADFARLIETLVEVTAEYLVHQVKNGAEAIQIFDSWAGVLSESQFRQWVIAPTKALVEHVRKTHPNTPIIGFPRGAGALYADYAAETGVDAVSLDSAVPLAWAAAELQSRCAVQGNLDNLALLVGGSVLEQEARRILAALARGPFVFNLGHGVLPETPPEHVAQLAATVRGWAPEP
jgi:uroporphyrinogen decarboxylase